MVHMQASPEQIWPLISDIRHVKRNGLGPVYWSVCTIDACEPNREFAFTVGVGGRPVDRWRYQLEPNHRKTNVENMRTTLQRMKTAVEAS
jgi:hypothetical protein